MKKSQIFRAYFVKTEIHSRIFTSGLKLIKLSNFTFRVRLAGQDLLH